ncbi:lytic transglycosylase domain-containing protein [Hippea alviniae]|uniref:lytic transglycosylase domain-containing protein n=1 Tax=Hippea alviniae TaxID=1279027 RepID=UPI0003B30CE3|nr:lytic transglycosylase domain-containing protein [Hippea alviniae]
MRIILIVMLAFFVSSFAYSGSLRLVKKNGEVVYTNLSSNLFFARAFREASSKSEVMKLIKKISKRYGVDYKLVVAIAKIESDFDANAVSNKGAKGVMQLMDKTAKFYGVDDPYDVEKNVEGGVRFLKHLIEKYHDVKLVAAAYNAGETAVDRYKGIPPYRETRRYVEKFLRVYNGKKVVYVADKRTKKHINRLRKVGNVYTNIGYSLW